VGHGIGSVECVIPEIPVQRAMKLVRAGLGLHVDFDTRGAPECRIEPVRDDLELIDRVLAVLGLSKAVCSGILRDLLAGTIIASCM